MHSHPDRDAIRFLLGHEPRHVRDVDPTQTVLEYLRGTERMCGTKEGCAEGDCGACTVVLAEPSADGLRYIAVNSCILFVPALDGRQLIVVEHLAGPDGALHRVQRAMVEHHASQCGFCTPGFVMSMFAACHGTRMTDRAEIDTVLAGNLCRCTGYRPIVDAALDACARPSPDQFTQAESEVAAQLLDIAPVGTLSLHHGNRRFWAPDSVGGLAALLEEHPDAVVLAGGTDMGLWVTKQFRELEKIIAIGAIAELRCVEQDNGTLRIGAGACYSEALDALESLHPALGNLVRRIGSVQVRNSGTIGGNVANASPIGDMAPALMALGAILILRRGTVQRSLPIEDFFLAYRRTAMQPGEFLERIDIPAQPAGAIFGVHKVSKRPDQDISAVCGAYRLVLRNGVVAEIRLAYGGMAGIPARATGAEQALLGKRWNKTTIESAMAAIDTDFTPLSDMRASAAYRATVARNLLLKLYLDHAA